MVFGFMVGQWHWAVLPALVATVAVGAAARGDQRPAHRLPRLPRPDRHPGDLLRLRRRRAADERQRADLHQADPGPARDHPAVSIPLLGDSIPDLPLQVATFLLPVVVVVWLLVNRTVYGRKLYAVGTNDVAARFANIPVRRSRLLAYLVSGLLSGIVAVVTVAQFASARPDAGSVGNGMALPAITIAVLGGVAITGGVGRVAGVILAALLVVWLNAGILLAFEGSDGSQFQLFALGASCSSPRCSTD